MPDQYVIQTLLNSGTQPYPDLPEDELDALALSIRRKGLLVKIQVGEDDTLVDGHQRLKAMQRNGKKRINASDVEVIQGITKANAFERAVSANWNRRHLTGEIKAARIRLWQREQRWSQGKIAKETGVSQAAISQLLRKHPAPEGEEAPDAVLGRDGSVQDVKNKRTSRPTVQYAAWEFRGSAGKLLVKAQTTLETLLSVPLEGIDVKRGKELAWSLSKIRDAADTLRKRLDGEDAAR